MSTTRRGSSCAESGGSHRSTGSWGSTVATNTKSRATMTREMLRNLDVGPAFVEALDVRERKTLGVSVDSAWRLARRSRAAVEFAAGRVALREGRRRVATAYFRRALREGGSAVRLRAMVGLASVYLGTDLDAISGVYRHIRVRQEANELGAVEQADALETLDLRPDH